MQTKSNIFWVTVAVAITPFLTQKLHAAQSVSQADIQWLQHMSLQLEDLRNRDQPGIRKHLTHGIKKKVAQKLGLATLPFPRPIYNLNQLNIDTNMLTSETTLFLRTMETANFPAIKAIMENGVSPLELLDLPHSNGQDRVRESHLGCLFALATCNDLPVDKYVETFIQLLEYIYAEKACLDDFHQAREALENLNCIHRDHKNVILDMLGGDKVRRRKIELIEPEKIINSLHWSNEGGRTLLDSLVERSAIDIHPCIHCEDHENARHRLQTYLLEKVVRLNQQSSLHNAQMQYMFRMPVRALAYFASALCSAIVFGRSPLSHQANLEISCRINLMMYVYTMFHFHNTARPIVVNRNLVLKLGIPLMLRCAFLCLQPQPERITPLIESALAMVLSSYLHSLVTIEFDRKSSLQFLTNIAKEQYYAWKQGITNISGRKIPERPVDEVGGLE